MASINPEEEGKKKEIVEPIVLHHSPQKKLEDVSGNINLQEKLSQVEKKVSGNERGKIMRNLRENFNAIKRTFEDRGESLERTRIYQVWPGKNVFFFHGRLVCGPDPRGFLLTTVSIILSSWIFSVYIGQDLPNRSGLIVTISEILTLLVLGNLVLVSAIDPGIIPRNEQDLTEDASTSNNSGTSRKKRITINGVELKLKYCRICKIFRPPRSCHCVVCDNCVEKFDHHCPWIGQCIALRNYRFYLTFVVSALAFFIYLFSFSCLRIHQRMTNSGTNLLGLLKNCPETLALALFSLAAALFLSGLVLFHMHLIVTNQTAYENFRQRFAGSKSPYDMGIIGNVKEFLFKPMPPSRVDFRAEVTPRFHHPTAANIHEV